MEKGEEGEIVNVSSDEDDVVLLSDESANKRSHLVDSIKSKSSESEEEEKESNEVAYEKMERDSSSDDGQTASKEHENMEIDDVDVEASRIHRVIPKVDCKEKIIFALDVSRESLSRTFRSQSSESRTTLMLCKMAIDTFVKTKAKINPTHEYAIVSLTNKAEKKCDFTSNALVLCDCLQGLKPSHESPADVFDMSSLMETVAESVSLPDVSDPSLPPPYVVRLILIYTRSRCHPKLSNGNADLFASPYFFFDILYIHQPPTQNPECEAIYDELLHLDRREANYILETSCQSNAVRLFNAMSLLMGHPLQRPLQMESSADVDKLDKRFVH
ncbi:BRISC and BRCA1-A complex member 1-like [Oscarella lobularis]|uniref:BRISC and BRCA1-A complex member 1-like n=1 Tax=Oscarella lobularis TaxID=121494 RepID=UPI003313A016